MVPERISVYLFSLQWKKLQYREVTDLLQNIKYFFSTPNKYLECQLPYIFNLLCLFKRFYKWSIYSFYILYKESHKWYNLMFSLLVICFGKTSWNQNGWVKGQVYLDAWYFGKVGLLSLFQHLLCYLISDPSALVQAKFSPSTLMKISFTIHGPAY